MHFYEIKKDKGFSLIELTIVDDVLKAEFNSQQKIKLSLELGEKFLNDKFIENQLNKKI